MTADQAREAVDALAEQADGELVIYAWGGEPTQNPEALLAMVQQAQRYPNVKVLLISNGVMNRALLDRLLSFRIWCSRFPSMDWPAKTSRSG